MTTLGGQGFDRSNEMNPYQVDVVIKQNYPQGEDYAEYIVFADSTEQAKEKIEDWLIVKCGLVIEIKNIYSVIMEIPIRIY